MHQNLVPGPFLILVKNPKQLLHARNYFKKQDSLQNTFREISILVMITCQV